MNLEEAMQVYAAGTSEGAEKGWDSRGRGKKQSPALGSTLGLRIKGHLKYIDPEDLTKAEKNILRHVTKDPYAGRGTRDRIRGELKGIAQEDLSVAESHILSDVGDD